ncbi:MAG: RHS repeat-associated core domain-containing protein [Velocimicrobium sp.]
MELESVADAGGGGGKTTFEYDGNGNLTKEVNPLDGVKTYTYDSLNRMIGMEDENGYRQSFSYDAAGNMISYIDANQETAVGKNRQAFRTKETNYVIDYLSDANHDILSYETGFGATRVTYGRGSERLSQNVTIFPETPKSVKTDIAQENNGKSYFQTDRLGSALFASNQEGEVLRYADRDAWGNLQIPVQDDINSAGIADSLEFTNYNYDQVLDQYFAQARFYDAKQGRMLEVDPVNTGLNRYLYCKNDPLNYIDPLGATAQNVKAGVSISKKGIATAAATALTGYKKALSSIGNIGNGGSSFTNTSKCSSNKGTGNLHSLSMLVDDDTWYSPSKGNQIDRKTGKVVGTGKGTGNIKLTKEQKLLITTVYGEAANCSEASWEAIANVIMNRVGTREWKKYDTVTDVIENSGFDCNTTNY